MEVPKLDGWGDKLPHYDLGLKRALRHVVARWWLWLAAGFVLVCLAIVAWGVFADV